jgi:hypothetical protein
VASVSLKISGGDKLAAVLAKMAGQLGSGGTLNTGFLANATYPSKPGASAQINVATAMYFGEFGTSRSPPWAYFRRMIAAKSPRWGDALAKSAKASDYNTPRTLGLMGELIKGQLQESIVETTTPSNKPSTIARKGFDHPLIDTSHALKSVDYEVVT